MKRLPYREGTWFALPLSGGGYAVGLVARMSPKGPVLLGYFFGPKRETIPTLSEISLLQPTNAVKVKMFGDLGLINGEWKIIGNSDPWNREKWPMPVFIRKDSITKSAWQVFYSDLDPNKLIGEKRVPFETACAETDGLAGYGFIEEVLTDILDVKGKDYT